MTSGSLLFLLPALHREALFGLTDDKALQEYLDNPSVTIVAGRHEHGLFIRVEAPTHLGLKIEVEQSVTLGLKDLKAGQRLHVRFFSDGTYSAHMRSVQGPADDLDPGMVTAITAAYYGQFAELAGRLKTFLTWHLPDISEIKANLEEAALNNLMKGFNSKTAAAMAGTRIVKVTTPKDRRHGIISVGISGKNGHITVTGNEDVLEDLFARQGLHTAILRFDDEKWPVFTNLGAAIVKAVAETVLLEANIAALETFGARTSMWSRLVEIELKEKTGKSTPASSTNPSDDGESDYNEPAAGKSGLHSPSEAALHGSVPDEN